jgi:hypothetical protein
MAKRLPWSQPPLIQPAPGQLRQRFQQTRFQRRIAQAVEALEGWAINPWRRFSLLLIVLLMALVVGGGLGSITGALAYFDPVSALVAVLALETAVRIRGRLLAGRRDRLILQLIDMARIGLLYGLLLDGFKLL